MIDGKVLIVVEQLRRRVPGGAGTYAAGLLTGIGRMAEAGEAVPPVTLFASRGEIAIRRRGADRSRAGPSSDDQLETFGLPLIESRLPGPLLTRVWDAGIGLVPPGFAFVHATSLAVPPARGVPNERTFVTVHDLAWRQVPFAYPARGVRWHENAFVKALRRRLEFVVPSPTVADELQQAGAEPSRVTVIEPGGDHLPPPDFDAASLLLERNGVRGPFILSVGTLQPRKNLETLADAYSKIRGSLPEPWPLVVVGPAGWGPGLTARDGVVPVGSVSRAQLSALYARAELLAYVPLVEGFGLPPLEAMQAGTPVLASPIPSTGGAAFEVDPHVTEQIAEGLLAVATDSELREDLVAAGLAHARKLSWQACARRHVELWKSRADGR